MANDAEKKRLKRNADALFLLYSVTGAVHAVYVLVCLVLGYGLSVRRGLVGVLHGAVMVLDALVVYTLRNWAASGVDLADPGLVEYLKDLVHLSWIVVVVACLTDYAWWLLLSAPLYALYKAVGLCRSASAGGAGDDDADDADARARGAPKKQKSRQERLAQIGQETRGGRPKFH